MAKQLDEWTERHGSCRNALNVALARLEVLENPIENAEGTWGISGIVENVDVENGVITIWTDEFDELQVVSIHPSMPGWMLRKDAAFRVRIPYQQAEIGFLGSDFSDWGRFEPQPYTHLSEDELLDKIFGALAPASEER